MMINKVQKDYNSFYNIPQEIQQECYILVDKTTIYVYAWSFRHKQQMVAPSKCHNNNSHAKECLYLCNLCEHLETVTHMQR